MRLSVSLHHSLHHVTPICVPFILSPDISEPSPCDVAVLFPARHDEIIARLLSVGESNLSAVVSPAPPPGPPSLPSPPTHTPSMVTVRGYPQLAQKHWHQAMGALYEDVENFFGDIFAWYGRLVARAPWLFVLLPLLMSALLGLGLLNLRYETQVEVLYTPIGSEASRDASTLLDIFGDYSAAEFYPRQQVAMETYGEIIITPNKDPSGLGNATLSPHEPCAGEGGLLASLCAAEIQRMHRAITNVSVVVDDVMYSYIDVCAGRHGACVVEGWTTIGDPLCKGSHCDIDSARATTILLNSSSPGDEVIADYFIHGENLTAASALRIRYDLQHNTTDIQDISRQWEREFIKCMKEFRSDVISVYFKASESLDIELRAHVGDDMGVFIFSLIAVVLFATIIGAGSNCVTTYVMLAYAGVLATLMAIMAAFGLLSLLGLKFVNMSGVMPFLVLGIGVDDMFQLMAEWRQSNIRDSTEDRLASTFRSTAVSITITSLTDLIAFCIGATSPFVSVRSFCACSGVGIFFLYVNQLTFFAGCIVLHARRVDASRHWLFCNKTKSRDDMADEGTSHVTAALCAGAPPRRMEEEGGICRRISKTMYTFYPKFLLNWKTKFVVIVLFITYITFASLGALTIQRGFKLEEVVSEKSYLNKFLSERVRYFPEEGPTIMFVVNSKQDYSRPTVRGNISKLMTQVEESPYIVNGSTVSWLDDFMFYVEDHNLSTPNYNSDFISLLSNDFLKERAEFKEDVKFDTDLTAIVASRFYVKCIYLEESESEEAVMLRMRRLANSSPYSVIAYSTTFIYYEHYVGIFKNTLLPVGVAMIGLLFVALVFIPHPIAVACVSLSMVSIAVGMVGFMHYWDLALSAVTVIQIIMSLGMCVSFTVQMCHSFMTATGKNRNERVTVAIEKVGIPILNGALSSLFCGGMLSFGTSFIFTSFFKTMVLVFFLGVTHSLIFLPVMLSFIGPRRTSKPRVFIPISSSCRSLQDTYRANSITRPPDPGRNLLPRRDSQFQSSSPDILENGLYSLPEDPEDVYLGNQVDSDDYLSEAEGGQFAPRGGIQFLSDNSPRKRHVSFDDEKYPSEGNHVEKSVSVPETIPDSEEYQNNDLQPDDVVDCIPKSLTDLQREKDRLKEQFFLESAPGYALHGVSPGGELGLGGDDEEEQNYDPMLSPSPPYDYDGIVMTVPDLVL